MKKVICLFRALQLFVAALIVLLGCPLATSAQESNFPTSEAGKTTRIHFGSCIQQDQPMPIFDTILADKPDLFLFLGDNIYGDTDDMAVMRAKYAQLAADQGFALLRTTCPVMAVWDDHDYGVNDAGENYRMRRQSQQVFVNFWGDAPGAERRKRDGVYDSTVSGAEGRRVQVILLDARFFRSDAKVGERRVGGPYYPDDDPTKTVLGEEQWKWLEGELKKPAEVRLIASGIQVIAEAAGQETWSNFPRERQRLFDLIAKTKAEGVIFLSGDRHWADLSMQSDGGTPYPLYDLTSSSLNQLHKRGTPTDNRYRAKGIETWHRENFGVIEVEWQKEKTRVHLRIVDSEGGLRIEKTLALSELRPAE